MAVASRMSFYNNVLSSLKSDTVFNLVITAITAPTCMQLTRECCIMTLRPITKVKLLKFGRCKQNVFNNHFPVVHVCEWPWRRVHAQETSSSFMLVIWSCWQKSFYEPLWSAWSTCTVRILINYMLTSEVYAVNEVKLRKV